MTTEMDSALSAAKAHGVDFSRSTKVLFDEGYTLTSSSILSLSSGDEIRLEFCKTISPGKDDTDIGLCAVLRACTSHDSKKVSRFSDMILAEMKDGEMHSDIEVEVCADFSSAKALHNEELMILAKSYADLRERANSQEWNA